MQRQSLGSPLSKLVNKEEQLISDQIQLLSSSSGNSSLLYDEGEDEEAKKMMTMTRLKHRTNTIPETYIHLIPMLTFICFLILYLSSHRLSPDDLAEFNVPKTLSNPEDQLQGMIKGEILAIRSLKNLEREGAAGRVRPRVVHRKIALRV